VSHLTKSARGMPCTVRLGGCNGNEETTVWAHLRSIRYGAGAGHKPADFAGLGAWACSACHDIVDGRVRTDMEREFIELQFLRGCAETAARLEAAGWTIRKPEGGLLDAYDQTDRDYGSS